MKISNCDIVDRYFCVIYERYYSIMDYEVLIQLDEPTSKVTWRYKVAKGGITQDASLAQEMGINPELELTQGIRWAQTTYPSDRFMLILWNHGNGILDEAKGYRRNKRSKGRRAKIKRQEKIKKNIYIFIIAYFPSNIMILF